MPKDLLQALNEANTHITKLVNEGKTLPEIGSHSSLTNLATALGKANPGLAASNNGCGNNVSCLGPASKLGKISNPVLKPN